jgi:hypothetical protein
MDGIECAEDVGITAVGLKHVGRREPNTGMMWNSADHEMLTSTTTKFTMEFTHPDRDLDTDGWNFGLRGCPP